MNHTKEAPFACGLLVQICVDARHLSVENYFHQSDMYLTSNAFFELWVGVDSLEKPLLV